MPLRCAMFAAALSLLGAASAAQPRGLMVDFKSSPSSGVSAEPRFSWIVPHLSPSAACVGVRHTDQRQHSYQLQIGHAAATWSEAESAALVLHDSGRLVTEESANVKASLAPLAPGTAFTWRVRTWSSADADECGSEWATGRFTTALFDGFAAQPIWLGAADDSAVSAAAEADVKCDLAGEWKGNGNGGAGVPISIASAASGGAGHDYVANCSLWTNKLVDLGNGTLVLFHGDGPRIAYARPYHNASPCTRIKFDNGDDWCKAAVCGAGGPPPPPRPPPPPAKDSKSTYAYFRHTEQLRGDVASATIFVSANQDGSLFKLLSAYRLYVNGKVVSVGPGRSDSANTATNHTVYDSVDITAELKQAWAEAGETAAVTFAAQCYHHDSGPDAMFMLQAQVTYSSPQQVGAAACWRPFSELSLTPTVAPATLPGGAHDRLRRVLGGLRRHEDLQSDGRHGGRRAAEQHRQPARRVHRRLARPQRLAVRRLPAIRRLEARRPPQLDVAAAAQGDPPYQLLARDETRGDDAALTRALVRGFRDGDHGRADDEGDGGQGRG